jgi:LytS/YehU family sensor histidine kinase
MQIAPVISLRFRHENLTLYTIVPFAAFQFSLFYISSNQETEIRVIYQTDLKLGQEIEIVKEFLENETRRYQGKLSWKCFVDSEVDTELVVPRSLIQTFAEKAITYGLIQNGEGGQIEISVFKTELGVLAMVTDNGLVDGETSSVHQLQKEKLLCLDEYLRLFNSRNQHSITYSILGRSQGYIGASGSRVLITIQNQ